MGSSGVLCGHAVGHRMFHLSVFRVCTAVGVHAGGRLASSEGSGRCGGFTVTGDAAVSMSVPSLSRQLWFRLRHGALLRRERRIQDATSRYVGPGVYLYSRWRPPEVADRVWRALAPKGFAAMWRCCCVTCVLPPNCCGPRNGPAEYFFSSDLVRSRHHVRSTVFGKVNIADTEGEPEHEPSCMISLMRPLTVFVLRTGKTSMVVFAVASCASRTKLPWLPFLCAGGPQYSALCYTGMTLMVLGSLFFLFSPR
ncbi:hypothetical protein MOQ_006896 [Trypanosoma cruzi marinkellei]|uniref:Uncharacterized protein n=1 Tax=Trypanosoma cruzi marinkellei TaxID=85056 RepID=K2NK68_TRYCR|nr:hypothetical protein MOQ_006896 [Trypanosoma cruzi marinkellei]